jgi:hypothetical protein
MSRSRPVLTRAMVVGTSLLGLLAAPVRATSIGSMVQAYCLAAVQQELAQAGKVPPEGMAMFACRCVVDRLSQGTSLEMARSACRESTARR